MIEVSDDLGLDLLPSRGQKVRDLTVFDRGTYWIQGPVLEEIEEALGEGVTLTGPARDLYERMTTVELMYSRGKFEFHFYERPARPWLIRQVYERHRWLAMVERSESNGRRFYTRHRYHAVAAVRWLESKGYAVEDRSGGRLHPERAGQAECEFGEMEVELRRHQRETLEKSRERGHRIVVGDQPGLGKTITAGAILRELCESGRVGRILWVVPSSALTEQVRGEMDGKFGAEVFVLTGESCSRSERLGLGEEGVEQMERTEYERHGFVCTNWALFSKDFGKEPEYTEGIRFDAVVLDEAHRCQEGNLAYDAALALDSPYRIALSGTVMPNGEYGELFDMLNVVDPPAAPSKAYFEDLYYRRKERLERKMSEHDAENEAMRLTSKVALKYMLPKISVHSKEEVMEGLPELEEKRIHINFGKTDKQIFAAFKDIIHGVIEELKEFPSPWSLGRGEKGRYYALRSGMVMVYQDLRRFCAFGSGAVQGRVDEYLTNSKGTYRALRKYFSPEISRLDKLMSGAARSPKNRKVVDHIRSNERFRKSVVFCTEVEPNKRLALELSRAGLSAKCIMGKGNRLSEAEAEGLGQPPRFRDRDVEEVLGWFWMPWSLLSDFLISQRESGNLLRVTDGDREWRNFFYTSLAVDLPKGPGASFHIELREPAGEAEEFADRVTADGFYRAFLRDGGRTVELEYGSEPRKVLVCTDKLQEGVNLQEASCVVFYDYPFSIREREQRMSRVWRDGSRHERIYVTYVMNGVEYNIERKLQRKYEKTSALGLPDPSPLSMMDLISAL
jgi:superfamily II DNA or RNA helicase